MPAYRPIIACLFMFALWLGYAYTGVVQGQLTRSGNDVVSPSLSIGVSGAAHGAAGLTGYWEHRNVLLVRRDLPLDERIKLAAATPIDQATPYLLDDGNGLGLSLFSREAFRLFGPSLAALYWSFILLIGVTIILFCLEHRADPVAMTSAAAVVLAMIVQLNWTAIGHSGEIENVWGLRYFPALGVIPALHVAFSIIRSERSRFTLVTAAAQAFLLGLVLSTRETGAYLFIMLAVVAAGTFCAAWWHRSRARALHVSLICAAALAGFAVFQASLYAQMDGRYVGQTRYATGMWHRLYISLALHPQWPFEDVDCDWGPDAPLKPGKQLKWVADANAYCIWLNHVRAEGGTTAQGWQRILTNEYGAFVRDEFVRLAKAHPAQFLEVFAVYKPRQIWAAIPAAFNYPENAPSGQVAVLAVIGAAAIVFLAICAGGYVAPTRWVLGPAFCAVAFAATWPPQLVAWAGIHTNSDTVLTGLCLIITAALALIAATAMVSRRMVRARDLVGAPAE